MRKLGFLIILIMGTSLFSCMEEDVDIATDSMPIEANGGGENEDDPIPPPPEEGGGD